MREYSCQSYMRELGILHVISVAKVTVLEVEVFHVRNVVKTAGRTWGSHSRTIAKFTIQGEVDGLFCHAV